MHTSSFTSAYSFCRCLAIVSDATPLGRIDSLNVHDDSEIDWKKLPDEHWNNWSAHALQRRWLCMKRSVKGYEDMSHAGKLVSMRSAVLYEFISACRAYGHPPYEEGTVTGAINCTSAQEDHQRGDNRVRRRGQCCWT